MNLLPVLWRSSYCFIHPSQSTLGTGLCIQIHIVYHIFSSNVFYLHMCNVYIQLWYIHKCVCVCARARVCEFVIYVKYWSQFAIVDNMSLIKPIPHKGIIVNTQGNSNISVFVKIKWITIKHQNKTAYSFGRNIFLLWLCTFSDYDVLRTELT